jgi:geranylgeranyl pyrophosphate synthase
VLQLFSDNTENLDKLVTALGQIFQIWNDLVSLKSDKVNIKCFWIDGYFLLLL